MPEACWTAARFPGVHDDVLGFAGGHPLALSLVAEMADRVGADAVARTGPTPDVVQTLLTRFVDEVPSPQHRAALEICAHVRVTTEALLRSALPGSNAGELFAWLRGLSFIEQGLDGLFPHDLAREVLDADLRWRDPERYVEMHRKSPPRGARAPAHGRGTAACVVGPAVPAPLQRLLRALLHLAGRRTGLARRPAPRRRRSHRARRSELLAANPLARSRVVADHATDGDAAGALADLLVEAVDTLRDDPRDAKRHRALATTFFHDVPTQEAAAERLGLAFSTYRRHLTAGIDRVIDWLWDRELHGAPTS